MRNYKTVFRFMGVGPGAFLIAAGLFILTGSDLGFTTQPALILYPEATRIADGLCLILSGLALITAIWRLNLFAKITASLLLIASLVSLFSYLLINNISWLAELHLVAASNGALIAPNTAIVLILASFAILIAVSKAKANGQPLELGILGLLIIGVGLSALLGYISGVEAAYSWGTSVTMSFLTALAVIFLGIGISSLAWQKKSPLPTSLVETWRNMIGYSTAGILAVALMSSVLPLMPLYSYVHKETDRSLSLLVSNRALEMSRVLGAIKVELEEVSKNGLEEPLFSDHKFLRGLTRYDLNGQQLKSLGEEVPANYLNYISHGSTETSFKGLEKLSNNTRLIAVTPRMDSGGIRVGTDLASLRLAAVEGALHRTSSRLDNGTRTFLLETREGKINFFELDSDTNRLASGSPPAKLKEVSLDLSSKTDDGVLQPTVVDLQNFVFAYARVMNTPYIILTSIETADAYSNLNRQIIHYIGISVLLALIGVGGIYLLSTELLHSGAALQVRLRKNNRVLSSESARRQKVEAELLDSKASNTLIVANAPDGIITTDSSSEIISANPSANTIFGYSQNELTGKRISFLIPSLEAELVSKNSLSDKGFNNTSLNFALQTIGIRKDQTEFPLEVKIAEHNPKTGSANILFIRDISAQQAYELQINRSLSEKELLVKEIHHRVKNNMQIISSLLNLQSRTLSQENKKVLQVFQDSESRIQSIALLHEILYRSESLTEIDLETYINKLAFRLLSNYNTKNKNIKVKVDVSNISMNFDTAIPLGLIINELLTNSLKHAFVDRKTGEVIIKVGKVTMEEYSLTVQDSGTGMPSDMDLETSDSLGLRLVRNLAKQINGSLKVKTNESGTAIEILFGDAKN